MHFNIIPSVEYILPVVFYLVWGGNSFVLVVLVEAALRVDFICVVIVFFLFWGGNSFVLLFL